ncbi:hypothetical protein [Microbacterium sp. cf332]|uniref:hypothetical protein n=1 Tax=Microbacterium sp. cf332 TaxID=1761804 RepID=UPI00115F838B|nr:hypothetical protein [Microbacterium sp. cf332]
MANDIVDGGVYHGFMGGGWWRPASTQTYTNARIMEHTATLAWFYANERPWNSRSSGLYRNAELLSRLEAAIAYYTALQFPDGTYPEYEGRPSLAATTFGIVAQSDAYEALRKFGVSYESRLQLRQSIERAVIWFMNPESPHWAPPIRYFNQVLAGVVGAQRSLQVLTNPTTDQTHINERIEFLCAHGVAPAGFPHEPLGIDFGYNFTVALPDAAWLYTQTQHPSLVRLVKNYIDFTRFSVISEPGGGAMSHVPSLHSRNVVASLSRPPEDLSDRAALAKVFLDDVPGLATFFPTREEKVAARSAFATATQPIRALSKPDTSPRTWMYGRIAPDGPSQLERDEADRSLPALVSERFTKIGRGTVGDEYLFARRPFYYAVGAYGGYDGRNLSARQLGTLWSPRMGTVVVGTNDTELPEGWETVGPQQSFSTRKAATSVRYFAGRTSSDPVIDATRAELTTGLFAQRTESAAGRAQFVTGWGYWDRGVRFTFITEQSGECVQRIPLLLKPGDEITFSDGSSFAEGAGTAEFFASSFTLRRGSDRMLVSYGTSALRTVVRPSAATIAGGTIHRIGLIFEGQIDIHFAFLGGADISGVLAEAHGFSDGRVALRAILGQSVAELRIVGSGSPVSIDLRGGPADYRVIERTLASATAPSSLTLEAYDAGGARILRSSVSVRR